MFSISPGMYFYVVHLLLLYRSYPHNYSHIADLFFLRGQAAKLGPSFLRLCLHKNGGRHEHMS